MKEIHPRLSSMATLIVNSFINAEPKNWMYHNIMVFFDHAILRERRYGWYAIDDAVPKRTIAVDDSQINLSDCSKEELDNFPKFVVTLYQQEKDHWFKLYGIEKTECNK